LAYFYSLRSWLEVEPDKYSTAIDLLKSLQARYSKETKAGLYMLGWCWNEKPINWTRYLFYGADVTEEGLTYFKKTPRDLANLRLQISGYFHAQGEDGQKSFVFKVVNDKCEPEETEPQSDIT
jgi:hypothetical protein